MKALISAIPLIFISLVILLLVSLSDFGQTHIDEEDYVMYDNSVIKVCAAMIVQRYEPLAMGEPEIKGNTISYPVDEDNFGPGGYLLKLGWKPNFAHRAVCKVGKHKVSLYRYEVIAKN